MKKQVTALLCSAVVCGTACAAVMPRANATEVEYAKKVSVAAYEPIGDLDILSATSLSVTDEWIFNMIYDRLIEVDAQGKLKLGLAESFEFSDEFQFEWEDWEEPESYSLRSRYYWEVEDEYESEDELPWTPEDWQEVGYKSEPRGNSNMYLIGPEEFFLSVRLKEGICFSDGTPITAQSIYDVVEIARYSDEETLIHKQWEPISEFNIIDDYTFELRFDFSESSYGFMEFMYGLTSPSAGIFCAYGYPYEDNYIALGSGPYMLSNSIDGYVAELNRNEFWCGEGALTESFRYVYANDEVVNQMLLCGDADIGFINSLYIDNYTFYEHMFNINYIEGKPLAITYNLNGELKSDGIRKAVDYSIDNKYITDVFDLSRMSDDMWIYAARYSRNKAIDNAYDSGYDLSGLFDSEYYPSVKILVTYNSFDMQVADIVANMLESNNIQTEIWSAEYADLKKEWNTDNYDLLIADLDPSQINSVFDTYADVDNVMQYCQQYAKISANEATYVKWVYRAQRNVYKNAYMSYLGWKNKCIVSHESIKGLDIPQELHPLGDLGRLDFRRVYKEATYY